MDTPNTGYVYVIRNSKGLIKIGRTKNLDRRIKQLQTGNSEKLELLYYLLVEDTVKVERGLHSIFSYGRIEDSEWFNIDDNKMYCQNSTKSDNILEKIFTGIGLTEQEKKQLVLLGIRKD